MYFLIFLLLNSFQSSHNRIEDLLKTAENIFIDYCETGLKNYEDQIFFSFCCSNNSLKDKEIHELMKIFLNQNKSINMLYFIDNENITDKTVTDFEAHSSDILEAFFLKLRNTELLTERNSSNSDHENEDLSAQYQKLVPTFTDKTYSNTQKNKKEDEELNLKESQLRTKFSIITNDISIPLSEILLSRFSKFYIKNEVMSINELFLGAIVEQNLENYNEWNELISYYLSRNQKYATSIFELSLKDLIEFYSKNNKTYQEFNKIQNLDCETYRLIWDSFKKKVLDKYLNSPKFYFCGVLNREDCQSLINHFSEKIADINIKLHFLFCQPHKMFVAETINNDLNTKFNISFRRSEVFAYYYLNNFTNDKIDIKLGNSFQTSWKIYDSKNIEIELFNKNIFLSGVPQKTIFLYPIEHFNEMTSFIKVLSINLDNTRLNDFRFKNIYSRIKSINIRNYREIDNKDYPDIFVRRITRGHINDNPEFQNVEKRLKSVKNTYFVHIYGQYKNFYNSYIAHTDMHMTMYMLIYLQGFDFKINNKFFQYIKEDLLELWGIQTKIKVYLKSQNLVEFNFEVDFYKSDHFKVNQHLLECFKHLNEHFTPYKNSIIKSVSKIKNWKSPEVKTSLLQSIYFLRNKIARNSFLISQGINKIYELRIDILKLFISQILFSKCNDSSKNKSEIDNSKKITEFIQNKALKIAAKDDFYKIK